MMSTKQMVLALLVSAQIASAAEVAVEQQVSFFGGWLNSGKDVAQVCIKHANNNRTAIAAVVVASAVSAAAYYNWDRVQNAYNKAVAYVKENREAIVANLKVGGAVLGATGVVVAAGYAIYNKFFGNNNNQEVAPVVANEVQADQEQVENAVKEVVAQTVDKFNADLVDNLV